MILETPAFMRGEYVIMWELIEFSNLTSKYTQTLYRILKQFRSTGTVTIFENDWDKFVEIMDIPKGYAMSDIDKRILTPAIKELSEKTLFSTDRVIFENLKYEKKGVVVRVALLSV
ncbi:putative RepE [Campylobacter hyointestinalis subsp. hyointestinalis]|uniref:RepE n=1 Tax=Campylobacter hyointestinalis subsp. hyointestinalis TaxID=91352 RepID=A0A0S4SZ91_CAMHY|nr:putative RepE [Campylobacter hyointestinalis subsp. hyointestinalis]